jgi:hypothetical protein
MSSLVKHDPNSVQSDKLTRGELGQFSLGLPKAGV